MDKINIYGAGGHAKVIIDCILSSGTSQVECIFDDNENCNTLFSYPVLPPLNKEKLEEYPIIFAIGHNRIRKELVKRYDLASTSPILHNRSLVSSFSEIGEGSVMMPNSVINANATVGKHCILNTGAIVEHDCVLGDYVHITPNAALAGNVHIGEGTQIGIGAQVIQGVRIGKWCTIGAGAVIIKDVPDGATVVGNPGRIVKLNTPKLIKMKVTGNRGKSFERGHWDPEVKSL